MAGLILARVIGYGKLEVRGKGLEEEECRVPSAEGLVVSGLTADSSRGEQVPAAKRPPAGRAGISGCRSRGDQGFSLAVEERGAGLAPQTLRASV
jgi:hypothetical protein